MEENLDIESALKCKHDNGWYLLGKTHSYIYSSGFVEFDFTRRNKLIFCCNNGCGATRNVYLKASIKTWGKIKLDPRVKERKILSKLLI